MTRISMKALLGASTAAVIAAISLAPPASAQGQPGYMTPMPQAQPGSMPPAPQPNGYMPPQSAYAPPQQGTTEPIQLNQVNTRYPGPKVN